MGIDVRASVKRAATYAVAAACGVLSIGAQTASADVMQRVMRVGGASVQYKIVLPDGYDAAKAYPAVLVMGGGPQTMDTVDRTLERNFRAEAERRGYIVVAPAAPNGDLFFQGGERIFPEFLETILANHQIAGRKFHVAGPSNGGIAAMHVAALGTASLSLVPPWRWAANSVFFPEHWKKNSRRGCSRFTTRSNSSAI